MVTLNPALFELPQSEIKKYGNQALTYGSLTTRGLQTIVNKIIKFMDEPVTGFDLGCGDGELIYHLQILLPDSIWEGVEISEHRVSNQQRDVTIWQGDMLNESYKPYNLLHADNLCLDDDIADKLEEKISNEFSGIYLTYRTPQNMKFLKKALLLDTIMTETTWTTHPIQCYKLA